MLVCKSTGNTDSVTVEKNFMKEIQLQDFDLYI